MQPRVVWWKPGSGSESLPQSQSQSQSQPQQQQQVPDWDDPDDEAAAPSRALLRRIWDYLAGDPAVEALDPKLKTWPLVPTADGALYPVAGQVRVLDASGWSVSSLTAASTASSASTAATASTADPLLAQVKKERMAARSILLSLPSSPGERSRKRAALF